MQLQVNIILQTLAVVKAKVVSKNIYILLDYKEVALQCCADTKT